MALTRKFQNFIRRQAKQSWKLSILFCFSQRLLESKQEVSVVLDLQGLQERTYRA